MRRIFWSLNFIFCSSYHLWDSVAQNSDFIMKKYLVRISPSNSDELVAFLSTCIFFCCFPLSLYRPSQCKLFIVQFTCFLFFHVSSGYCLFLSFFVFQMAHVFIRTGFWSCLICVCVCFSDWKGWKSKENKKMLLWYNTLITSITGMEHLVCEGSLDYALDYGTFLVILLIQQPHPVKTGLQHIYAQGGSQAYLQGTSFNQ